MGSRGAFINVNVGNFTFREGGRIYKLVGTISGIKVLIQTKGASKAPEFSHSPNRMYAILQNNTVKHLAYYDENHRQAACIDFNHEHHGLRPHKHLYLNHKKEDDAMPLNSKDRKNIEKLKRRYHLR